MNINETIIQAAILFFPGIIMVSILQIFRNKKQAYSNLEIVFYSFILGTLVNIIVYGLILHKELPLNIYLRKITIENNILLKIEIKEFLLNLFVATYLGIVFSYFRNLGLLHSLMMKLDVTYETGFQNIPQYLLSTNLENFSELKNKDVEIKSLNPNIVLEKTIGKIMQIEEQNYYFEILLCNEKNYENYYIQLKKGEFEIIFLDSIEDETPENYTSLLVDEKGIISKSLIMFLLYLFYCNLGFHITLIGILIFFSSFKIFAMISIIITELIKYILNKK